jgi:hypothetical protein
MDMDKDLEEGLKLLGVRKEVACGEDKKEMVGEPEEQKHELQTMPVFTHMGHGLHGDDMEDWNGPFS